MNLSFRLKTVLGIALIETLALGLLIWSSISYLQDSNEQALAKRAQSTIRLFATMTQDAVITSDLARLESFASELFRLPEIQYVRIHGRNQVLAEAGDPGYLSQPFRRDLEFDNFDDDGVFDVDTAIEIEGVNFGRVELGLSIVELKKLVDKAATSLGAIALLEILAVALFSLGLGAYLTRSLRQLRDASHKISDGRLGITVPLQGQDEIGQVVQAFNQMSRRLLEKDIAQQQYLDDSQQLADDLKRSEQRMRTIMNTALDGFVIIDSQGIIIEINEATESTFGYTREQLVGNNVSKLMPPGYAREHDGYMRDYLTSGVSHVIGKIRELEGRRESGEIFPMELTVSEIRQGDDIFFVGLVRDLTATREAQEQLNYHQAIKNGISEASLDALVTINDEGEIIDFNRSAQNMYGLSRESVLGRDIATVIIPERMREAHKAGMRRFLQTGEGPVIGTRIEVPSVRNGNEEFPVELTVTPIKVKDRTFFTAFIRDISEQNEQKEALNQALVSAQQANRAKSKFLASMSHEIRTPINAVLGAMDLLEDSHMTSTQQKYIQVAKNSGQSLLSIVNNILDLSKIESGAMEVTESEFSLHQLVDDIVFMFASMAQEKNIEIVSCLAADLPDAIICDKGKLRQILINLISNGIKFTRNGGVAVHVAKSKAGEDGELVFSVRDSGVGIARDAIPQLFREFSQVENKLSAEHDGSGLGLSICKSLVELMQGSISVESIVGQGSDFIFRLPLHEKKDHSVNTRTEYPVIKSVRFFTANPLQEATFSEQLRQRGLLIVEDRSQPYDLAIVDESILDRDFRLDDAATHRVLLTYRQEPDPDASQVSWDHVVIKPVMSVDLDLITNARFQGNSEIMHSHNTQEINAIKNRHILVVDDSEANQLIARGMLEKAGYQVSLADNGYQAIDHVGRGGYDLVLMDVRMPKMDGLTATQKIRELGPGPAGIPIVALTANAVKEDLQKCLQAGMNAYLTKPVDRQEMLTTISDLLKSDDAKIEAAPARDTSPDQDSLIDTQAFRVLAEETSPELVSKMVKIFLIESKQRVEIILQSDIASDLEAIGIQAHTLKSTSHTFGAMALHRVTLALDKACKDGSLNTAETQILELKEVAARTFAWFDNNLESGLPIN